jgi:membrane protease YdiL (CAAX protease family)
MAHKTPSVISTVLTIILLVILAVLSILFEMLALNGASESQGFTAMGISLACQSVGLVLIGIFTWRFTNLLISKFSWNAALAVIVSTIAGLMLGMGISFFSTIISIPIAGIH